MSRTHSDILAKESKSTQPVQETLHVAMDDRSLYSPGSSDVANVNRSPAEIAPVSASRDPASTIQTRLITETDMPDEDKHRKAVEGSGHDAG
jgi:hypothetical protein